MWNYISKCTGPEILTKSYPEIDVANAAGIIIWIWRLIFRRIIFVAFFTVDQIFWTVDGLWAVGGFWTVAELNFFNIHFLWIWTQKLSWKFTFRLFDFFTFSDLFTFEQNVNKQLLNTLVQGTKNVLQFLPRKWFDLIKILH